MKKNLIIAVIAGLSLQLSSCNETVVDSNSDVFETASSYLDIQPDSTIVLTDAFLKLKREGKKGDEMLLRMLELRQQAFSRLAQIDSIVIVGEQIRVIAGRLNDSLAMAKSLLPVKGNVDFSHQQMMEPYFPPAIALFEREGKEFEKAKLSGTYGAILAGKGEFQKAQEYLLKAYSAFDKMDSIKQLFSVTVNVGNVYLEIGSDEKAMKYFKKGKSIADRLNNPVERASVMMNIGLILEKKNLDSALYIYNEALNLLTPSTSDILYVKLIYNIAGVEFKKGNIDKAEQLYNNILNISLSRNWYEGVAMVRGALSNVYESRNNFSKALEQELATASLFQSFGMGIELIRSRSKLLRIYENMGNIKAALQESKELKTLNDSILSIEQKVAIHDIETKYQSEKKEVENAKLKSELQSRKLLLLSLGFLLLVLVIALFIYRQRNLFLRERNLSYEVLMKKYREQMFEREQTGSQAEVLSAPIVTDSLGNKGLLVKVLSEGKKADDHISDLSQVEVDLLSKLEQLIKRDRLFLNPKLKIELLASKIGETERILSNLLNRHHGCNFSVYINRFRVVEARMLLERPDSMNLKLDAIGQSAGFGSRQNFYAVFEQDTGVNPGYYRSSIHG